MEMMYDMLVNSIVSNSPSMDTKAQQPEGNDLPEVNEFFE